MEGCKVGEEAKIRQMRADDRGGFGVEAENLGNWHAVRSQSKPLRFMQMTSKIRGGFWLTCGSSQGSFQGSCDGLASKIGSSYLTKACEVGQQHRDVGVG